MVNCTLSALHTHAPTERRLTAAPDHTENNSNARIKISHASLSRAFVIIYCHNLLMVYALNGIGVSVCVCKSVLGGWVTSHYCTYIAH